MVARNLYADAEHISQLEIFTKLFKERIVEIAARDVDSAVQVLGVELVTEMSR